jgi:hypothetical protein
MLGGEPNVQNNDAVNGSHASSYPASAQGSQQSIRLRHEI